MSFAVDTYLQVKGNKMQSMGNKGVTTKVPEIIKYFSTREYWDLYYFMYCSYRVSTICADCIIIY